MQTNNLLDSLFAEDVLTIREGPRRRIPMDVPLDVPDFMTEELEEDTYFEEATAIPSTIDRVKTLATSSWKWAIRSLKFVRHYLYQKLKYFA